MVGALKRCVFLIIVSLELFGCADPSFQSASIVQGKGEQALNVPVEPILPPPSLPDVPAEPAEPAEPSEPVEVEPPPFELSICSDLSFDGITWPMELNYAERDAFALALNVSGSFEGHNGWSNLTNNFDGMGISFGLLNQTLGTGSLQPLLGQFSLLNEPAGVNLFGTSNWNSLKTMVLNWYQDRGIVLSALSIAKLPEAVSKEYVGLREGSDKLYAHAGFGLSSANSDSVRWALQNVYVDNGRNFKTSWRNSFRSLGSHPDYISVQVEAARRIHNRAIGYFRRLGFTQLRAYLFLFDIVVQNGSLKERHFAQFADFAEENPGLTEQEYMLELLEIRVVDVIDRWKNDVRKRKRSLILDTGLVHGSNRNYPEEYCFEGSRTNLYESLQP